MSTKTEHQQRVEFLMQRITFERFKLGLDISGQKVQAAPAMISEEGCRLRAALILEEALETIEALGCEVSVAGRHVTNSSAMINVFGQGSLVDAVDGCFDLRVVTTGTLSALGVADSEGQRLVDENNLEKFAPGFKIREDGKLIKPAGHRGPDLANWLRTLGAKL